MAQLHLTNCDVCSEEMLSQTALMNHIQLHLSQFNRLINRSLSHYFAELDDNVGTDADSDHSTTPPEKKTPAKRLKVWKCPCKTCDHGAFRRKQELVQHYATRMEPVPRPVFL
ncbi:hypothetical protein J3459_022406 [Metarhizium acridum]|nr:hypothetical protein J3459_022406 [Metarhizium acridum]